MTITLFIVLVTMLSLVDSLLTQAIKKTFDNTKPTLVAAIIAALTGWGGGVCAYVLMGIAFTPASAVCLILLAPVIWLGATLGYDKVIEVIKQIGALAPKKDSTDEN